MILKTLVGSLLLLELDHSHGRLDSTEVTLIGDYKHSLSQPVLA
jgi:hypothetical protein